MTRKEVTKFLVLNTIGNFLVLFAIFGFFSTFGPALYFELQYRIIQARGVKYIVADSPQKNTKSAFGQLLEKDNPQSTPLEKPTTGGLASVLTGSKEQILIPKDPNFSILIPRLGANTKVSLISRDSPQRLG